MNTNAEVVQRTASLGNSLEQRIEAAARLPPMGVSPFILGHPSFFNWSSFLVDAMLIPASIWWTTWRPRTKQVQPVLSCLTQMSSWYDAISVVHLFHHINHHTTSNQFARSSPRYIREPLFLVVIRSRSCIMEVSKLAFLPAWFNMDNKVPNIRSMNEFLQRTF